MAGFDLLLHASVSDNLFALLSLKECELALVVENLLLQFNDRLFILGVDFLELQDLPCGGGDLGLEGLDNLSVGHMAI